MHIKAELEALRDRWRHEMNGCCGCADDLDAIIARLPPDAVAVPREPREAMRQIGGETNCPTETLTSAMDYAEDVYRAMLQAAEESQE